MCDTRQAFENSNMLISDAFPNLEDLNIDYSKDMVGLPKGLCDITSLKMLSISNCHKLFQLPLEIGNLVNLKLLRLSSCTDLEGLPNSIARLSNLRHIWTSQTALAFVIYQRTLAIYVILETST